MNSDCPSWCAVEHDPNAHPDDQLHSTLPIPIPVVTLARVLDHNFDSSLFTLGAVYDVVLFQYALQTPSDDSDARAEEWVFIGGDEDGLTVTKESAQRIYRALGEVLTAAG